MRFWLVRSVLLFTAIVTAASQGAPISSAQDDKPAQKEEHPATEAKSEEAKKDEAHPTGAEAPHAAGDAHAKTDEHAAGHDSGHNPYDHSHSNAGPSQDKPEEWKYDLAIWTLVVFFLLVAVLGKFAWGPIATGLEKREHSIESMIADAKRNQDEAKALLANYETKLAASQEEFRAHIEQGRREGEAVAAKIVADAQAAATRERERSVTEIEQAKNAALGEIAAKSVDVAMGLAGKIVRRQITGEDQKSLLREAVEGIASRN
jgi:F-type H+-transporting ATPase subunit b